MRKVWAAACVVACTLHAIGCSPCLYNSDTAPNYANLPDPPINTYERGSDGSARTARSRGVVDIRLDPAHPSFTVWNDPAHKQSPWGTVTLIRIDQGCRATILFNEQELTTTPGNAFPGTGLYLVRSDAETGSIWIRSRWIHSYVPIAMGIKSRAARWEM